MNCEYCNNKIKPTKYKMQSTRMASVNDLQQQAKVCGSEECQEKRNRKHNKAWSKKRATQVLSRLAFGN